jgi:hypothetical protein
MSLSLSFLLFLLFCVLNSYEWGRREIATTVFSAGYFFINKNLLLHRIDRNFLFLKFNFGVKGNKCMWHLAVYEIITNFDKFFNTFRERERKKSHKMQMNLTQLWCLYFKHGSLCSAFLDDFIFSWCEYARSKAKPICINLNSFSY